MYSPLGFLRWVLYNTDPATAFNILESFRTSNPPRHYDLPTFIPPGLLPGVCQQALSGDSVETQLTHLTHLLTWPQLLSWISKTAWPVLGAVPCCGMAWWAARQYLNRNGTEAGNTEVGVNSRILGSIEDRSGWICNRIGDIPGRYPSTQSASSIAQASTSSGTQASEIGSPGSGALRLVGASGTDSSSGGVSSPIDATFLSSSITQTPSNPASPIARLGSRFSYNNPLASNLGRLEMDRIYESLSDGSLASSSSLQSLIFDPFPADGGFNRNALLPDHGEANTSFSTDDNGYLPTPQSLNKRKRVITEAEGNDIIGTAAPPATSAGARKRPTTRASKKQKTTEIDIDDDQVHTRSGPSNQEELTEDDVESPTAAAGQRPRRSVRGRPRKRGGDSGRL